MKVRVPIAWRRVLKWSIRCITATGVIIGFIALPPWIAGPLGLALVVFNSVLERARFYAHILHVMPFPSYYVIENNIASLWGIDESDDDKTIFFGQVFRTQRAAKEAYQLFRAWNFGDYIDRNGNIVLSVVREELDRFTILLFPGERGVTDHAESKIAEEFGEKTEAVVSKIMFWFSTFADYWNRPNMKTIIDRLPGCSKVLLNCYYLQDGEPRPVAKRQLELSNILVVDRAEVPLGSLESYIQWQGPWTGMDRETREKYDPVFQAVNERGNSASII